MPLDRNASHKLGNKEDTREKRRGVDEETKTINGAAALFAYLLQESGAAEAGQAKGAGNVCGSHLCFLG